MSREKRREIPEWVTWLALALLALLVTLPFVTEENADRIFRLMPALALFILPLIMLLRTMFPRGLRLPLGRWVLRIAPPASYFVTYYSLSRWLDKERERFAWTADELADLKSEQDDMTRDIQRDAANIADAIGLEKDAAAELAGVLFMQVYVDGDAALAAWFAAAIDDLRSRLRRPQAATTTGLWDQIMELSDITAKATALSRARLTLQKTFITHTLPKALGLAGDALARLEQRSAATAAQIAAIEAEVAEVTQPGRRRGRTRTYTEKQVLDLYDAFLQKPVSQSHDGFCTEHGIPSRQQMYQLFDRDGLEWRSKENQ